MMASASNDPPHAGTIWATNLDESRPNMRPLIPVDFRPVEPESIEALAEAMGGSLKAEALSRFEAGKRCYAAWAGDRIAAYGWVSYREEYVGEFNVRVRLLPGEAYIWDCLTAPEYRQKGLYSALLVFILQELQSEGLCRAWIGADLDNVPSQRGIERAGFRRVADMVLERVLALRMVWIQGRPGVPEGAVAEARRVFLDNRDTAWLRAMQLLTGPKRPVIQAPETPLPEPPASPDASDSLLSAGK